ncbi:glycoside hydrolase [Saccharopolyspora shandongensis]|uniref:glycoside hydrolase n=1 Tax=Saccharopolyspora shandongensis TaxID=418495 RepID=UPI001FE82F10|nr:glycoside hydrolase [Saccharopolyspora shandongensis]
MKRDNAIRLAGLLGVLCVATTACATATASDRPEIEVNDKQIVVPVKGGRAVVDTTSLGVRAEADDGANWQLSAPAADALGAPSTVAADGGKATWRYPAKGLTVTAATQAGRLEMTVHADEQGSMTWPVTGTDRSVQEIQFPRGEGLSVPAADPWWNSDAAGLAGAEFGMADGLTMPFWGTSQPGHGAGYIAGSDIGTSLRFVSDQGRLRTEAVHDFTPQESTMDYTMSFALTDGSPVAAARDYRDWLQHHGGIEPLQRKIARNPEVGKLIGAFHAYTWGEARTPEGIQRMRQLGLNRMWLGYDADDHPMTKQAVDAANQAGYLVGPYDSWANAQDPATADNPSSRWPAPVWQDACVRDAQGKVMTGFGGRGCYLSSESFARAEPTEQYLANRTREMTANGATSYFLDVDAAGELHTDHSPQHPMNKAEDRKNRLDRIGWLSGDRKLVLGSENSGAWANRVLTYSHGSLTPVSDGLWKLQKDRETWGGYAPQGAPAFFFKPVHLPADLAKAMFAPQFRVPLYQTVLHDSVISTDRWELSWSKLPDQSRDRAMLAMLYNTPLNLVLDKSELDSHGKQIAELQRYFEPLHEAAATEPMTDFRWLTPDHLVQRTSFGDSALTVTANFSAHPHDGLPAGCVDASVKGGTPQRICPTGL